MPQTEIILFWITTFCYVLSFCLLLFAFVGTGKRFTNYAIVLLWSGFAAHTATIIIRWIDGHHPPVTSTYELNLTGTWFAVLTFALFQKMRKADPIMALIVIPVVFLILGHGLISRTDAVPMSPAYRSPWLVIHVIFAWLAFGSYLLSTAAAILLLLRKKLITARPQIKIPQPEALDLTGYRFIILGFINHAVMLISGAIWAKNLWGHYWSWDPLEIWSLLAFLFYAFYLHTRSFLKWKMNRAAYLAILGLILLAISFWGVDWFSPSIHPGP